MIPRVIWSVSYVYSRVVDISKEKPFFVIVVNDFTTAALCEYVYKWFTVLVSTSWAQYLGFVYLHTFLISLGTIWKHLNVHSSFYTELLITWTAPPAAFTALSKHSPEILEIIKTFVLQSTTDGQGVPDC